MPLKRLIRQVLTQPAQDFDAPIAPEAPFYAIGDIHGAYDAMDRLLDQIANSRDYNPIVCVGDYVDRGDRSAEVLKRLHYIATGYPDLFVCLKGNHEEMLLSFLDDPKRFGARWLRHGGLQTLASFRIPAMQDEEDIRDALAEALGDPMITWLRRLPVVWRSGNVAVTHAGADPALPIDEQSKMNFVWGHPNYTSKARRDGVWVVNGHEIVDAPRVQAGRIMIDTGAYATGALTAARIGDGSVQFLVTER